MVKIRTGITKTTDSMAKKNYYLTARPNTFDRDCQVVQVGPAQSITDTAMRWGQTNDCRTIYIHDMNHQLVTSLERII